MPGVSPRSASGDAKTPSYLLTMEIFDSVCTRRKRFFIALLLSVVAEHNYRNERKTTVANFTR
jgi:hypothetical protein